MGSRVAEAMVSVNPVDVLHWLKILRPAKTSLLGPLRQILRNKARPQTDRVQATIYLVDYFGDSPIDLVDLLMDAEPKEFGIILQAVKQQMEQAIPLLQAAIHDDEESASADENKKDQQAEREAKAAVALVHLGSNDAVWPLLAHRSDPRLRSFIIHWLELLGADPWKIIEQIQRIEQSPPVALDARRLIGADGSRDPNHRALFDPVTSKRRALILALGRYDPDRLLTDDREREIPKLLALYRNDPDPGVHSAAHWTLRRWGQAHVLRRIDAELAKDKNKGNRRWFVNSIGQTMVVVDGPVDFLMGSPESDPFYKMEKRHTRRILRRIAMSSMEVSIAQFEEFLKDYLVAYPYANVIHGSKPDQPQPAVTWYLGAAFCNWLSGREGLREVYEPTNQHRHAKEIRIRPGALDLDGYRLPTEAEWEYACRAGTLTSRFYGNTPALLRNYARLDVPEKPGPLPCGSLMPNDFGLFDMLGNLGEWCHDREYEYESVNNGLQSDSQTEIVMEATPRLMRGGSFTARTPVARSANRYTDLPADVNYSFGFRVVRTLP